MDKKYRFEIFFREAILIYNGSILWVGIYLALPNYLSEMHSNKWYGIDYVQGGCLEVILSLNPLSALCPGLCGAHKFNFRTGSTEIRMWKVCMQSTQPEAISPGKTSCISLD